MPRIMIVDDDRNMLRSLGRVIHFMPIAALQGEAIVECFEKPAQALARAAECEFDLAIADYLMPAMNGIAFMRELIQLRPNTPRILLSGYANILEAMDGMKGIGPIELLSKPWNNDKLKELIVALLQARRQTLPASVTMQMPRRFSPAQMLSVVR